MELIIYFLITIYIIHIPPTAVAQEVWKFVRSFLSKLIFAICTAMCKQSQRWQGTVNPSPGGMINDMHIFVYLRH